METSTVRSRFRKDPDQPPSRVSFLIGSFFFFRIPASHLDLKPEASREISVD